MNIIIQCFIVFDIVFNGADNKRCNALSTVHHCDTTGIFQITLIEYYAGGWEGGNI